MKIRILGSAAAEGIPAYFCNCSVCRKAKKNGGKDIRRRTVYELHEQVRIDFGPDTLWQEQSFNLDSSKLRHLFITHSHEDHLYSKILGYRRKGFSILDPDNILNVYGNFAVMSKIQNSLGDNLPACQLNLVQIEDFYPVEIPELDMKFYPLTADHAPNEKPYFFAFRIGGKYGMIANDTGYFPEMSWDFIKSKEFKFDVVIADCTGGTQPYERGHMGGETVIKVKERLKKIGAINNKSRFIANHFSHNGKAVHAELEAFFNPHGIEVGFDGMEIQVK